MSARFTFRLSSDSLIFQDVQSNRDECELLRTRLLELLPVVMMAVQRDSAEVGGQVIIPADLKSNVERFQRFEIVLDAEALMFMFILTTQESGRHREGGDRHCQGCELEAETSQTHRRVLGQIARRRSKELQGRSGMGHELVQRE